MKKAQIYSLFFLTWLLTLQFIGFTNGQSVPRWVGVDEGDSYIWNVTIDEGPLESFWKTYFEEVEEYSEEVAEEWAENTTDAQLPDEDVVQIKIFISELKKVDNDYVRFLVNLHEKEEDGILELEEEEISYDIINYNFENYTDYVSEMFAFGFNFFVANDIIWNDLVFDVNREWKDFWDEDYETASCSVLRDFQGEYGISTVFNYDEDDFEDFNSISAYNENGVLRLFECKYDGKIIAKVELENAIVYQYLGLIIVGAIALIALIALIINRRR